MKDFKQVDCFKKNLQLWKVIGIYPLALSRPLLYAIYSKIFIVFFIVMYSTLFTINLYFIPKEVNSYIDELICYFSVLSVLCKVLTFLFKKDDILNIINILESEIFQPKSKEEIKIINEAKNTNQRYFKIYSTVCIIANLIHVFSPLLVHFIFNTDLFLPVCSYAFLSDSTINDYIYPLYLYQSIGMYVHVLYVISIDNFIVGTTIFVVAQLDILENKCMGVTENYEAEIEIQQNEADENLHKVLLYYEEVAKFCRVIEDVFSVAVFVHFSMGSYIICMCLIKFTMTVPWQYYIFLATYTSAMLIQIFIPCWIGTCIMDKSRQLGHAIYSCDWTPRSKRFKSSMRLFVERTKRPLSITGCKMFLLSLTTFSSIMNTAYSFFTLLRQMQSR